MKNTPLPKVDNDVTIARPGASTAWTSKAVALDASGDDVVLVTSVPADAADDVPAVGTSLLVRWRDGDRVYLLPVDVDAADGERWHLRPTAHASWQHGNRQHERGGFDSILGFRLAGRDVRGRGVDVSEGGLRCELLDDPGETETGDRVAVEFDVVDEYILTFATVVRLRETEHGTTELALKFEGLKPGAADSIRAHVDDLAGGG